MTHDTSSIEAIASLPLIRRLPAELHQELARLFLEVSEERICDPDETLIREGEIGGSMGFVLLSGTLKVERTDTAPLAIEAPALVGEMHQFNPHAERSATVTTVGPARLRVFPWHDFYAQARQRFPEDVQHKILESLELLVLDRVDSTGFLSLPLFQRVAEPLKVKSCMLLLWLGRHRQLEEGELLFEQDSLCGNAGHLLLRGSLVLTSGQQRIREERAPGLVGVQPDFNPDRRWTATARAMESTEVLVFSWMDFLKRLEKRLTGPEFKGFVEALKAGAAGHFSG